MDHLLTFSDRPKATSGFVLPASSNKKPLLNFQKRFFIDYFFVLETCSTNVYLMEEASAGGLAIFSVFTFKTYS